VSFVDNASMYSHNSTNIIMITQTDTRKLLNVKKNVKKSLRTFLATVAYFNLEIYHPLYQPPCQPPYDNGQPGYEP